MESIPRLLRYGIGIISPVVLAAVACGCGPSGKHFDDRDWTKDHGIQTAPWRAVETLFSEEEGDSDRFNYTLRGVRLDLTMSAEGKPTTRCHCLDVAVGRPDGKQFAWAGSPPTVATKSMVLAVRSKGSSCQLPSEVKLRPSIQAVDKRGKDVIVVIEELPYDRPQALGAVIPKPSAEGHLYVRSRKYRNKVLPYAVSLEKHKMCIIATDPRDHHQQIRSGRRF